MIQLLSKINLTDNSGVLEGKVIKVLTPKNAKIAKLGSLILISCKSSIKNSGILPGTKFKALVVRLKKTNLNNKISWNQNNVVLVKLAPKNNEFLPISSRIKGPINSNLLRLNGYQKVVSLAKHVI